MSGFAIAMFSFCLIFLIVFQHNNILLSRGECSGRIRDGKFHEPQIVAVLQNISLNGILRPDKKVLEAPECKIDVANKNLKAQLLLVANSLFLISRTLFLLSAAAPSRHKFSNRPLRESKPAPASPQPGPQPRPPSPGPQPRPPSPGPQPRPPSPGPQPRPPSPGPQPRPPSPGPQPSQPSQPVPEPRPRPQVPYRPPRPQPPLPKGETFQEQVANWKPYVLSETASESVHIYDPRLTEKMIQETIYENLPLGIIKIPTKKLGRAVKFRVVAATVMLVVAFVANIAGRIVTATAAMLPRNSGTGKCFEQTVNYVEAAYDNMIREGAILKLQGYRNLLEDVDNAVGDNCQKVCNITLPQEMQRSMPKCSDQFIQRLLGFYDQIKRDRHVILEPVSLEMWSIFFARELCVTQFSVGTRIVGFTDEKQLHHAEYLERLVLDTMQCVAMAQVAIDNAIQNFKGEQLKYAAMYRAVICRDFQPFFTAFAVFYKLINCTDDESPKLQAGHPIMLRDTSLPVDGQWFSCDSKEACRWTSCPGIGPKLNDTGDSADKIWQSCEAERLLFYHEYDARRVPIKVGARLNLYTSKGLQIYWDYSDDGGCSLQFLPRKYSLDKPGRTTFIAAAWDWSGRRRQEGENIYDRDYLVLYYDDTPDYQLLSKGRGLYYIEGFLFISEKIDAKN